MHAEFTAFLTDEDSLALARTWAEGQGFPSTVAQAGGAEILAASLESEAPAKLILVDIDGHAQPTQIAARLVSLCGPAAKLVAVGTTNDVELYRKVLAAGMMDYIVKPLTPEKLTQALAQATQGGSVTPEAKASKTIVVLGTRGGVGASTLAVNLGWTFAHQLKQTTTLLDLDLPFGLSALALDLEPGRGLRDIVSAPQRVDSLMVASALTRESERFSVLSAEESVEDSFVVDGTAVSALIKELRVNAQIVLVDVPRHLFPTQKRLFALAQDIVLVTEMSLAGIRDTLRIRAALKTLGCVARITLVAKSPAAVDEATFTKGAQAKIDFTLPYDPQNTAAASNAGKPLGALTPNAPLSKALDAIAHYLVDSHDTAKPVKKSLLTWLREGKA